MVNYKKCAIKDYKFESRDFKVPIPKSCITNR